MSLAVGETANNPRSPGEPSVHPGGIRGIAPVHNLLNATELKLRWSVLANLALGVALTLSLFGHLWVILSPPTPEYFATTADGRLMPLVPISEPYVPQEALLTWATQSATQAYTIDYVHKKQQLSALRELFTAEGFRGHLQALDEAGILTAVEKRRLITRVVATHPPVITNQGVLGSRYAWRVEVPLQISYEGGSSTSPPQRNLVELLIVRVPTHELPRGYAIHQMVARPAPGGRP